MYIPQRFINNIDAHMLGNLIDICNFPVILTIIGKPGMGKTYQLRNYLKLVGVEVLSINAADLESSKAGQPAKLLEQRYIEASSKITNGKPAVLLIDDIDTTVGEWKNNTGTVNHQGILAFLMHIADNPTYIENVGKVNRVPIFFTGNDFSKLYEPLVRFGRANKLDWYPNDEEKANIIKDIFEFDSLNIPLMLINDFPEQPISFFSDLLEGCIMDNLVSLSGDVVYKYIITDESYKQSLILKYNNSKSLVFQGDIYQMLKCKGEEKLGKASTN